MAKLTAEEIENLQVIRATFDNGKWVVLVSDENNFIYRAMFDGLEGDDNSTIITKTKVELLEVDKFEPIVVPTPIIREDITGINLKQ